MNRPTMKPGDVAEFFGVEHRTVVEWFDAGLLPGVNLARPSATNRRLRFSEADLETFVERRSNQGSGEKPKRRPRQKPSKEFV